MQNKHKLSKGTETQKQERKTAKTKRKQEKGGKNPTRIFIPYTHAHTHVERKIEAKVK